MNQQKRVYYCSKGHKFYKSSDCRTCPKCEAEKRPGSGLLALLAAPARRTLEGLGIRNLKQLSAKTESEIAALHGMGPSAMKILRKELEKENLKFKSANKNE